jgi:hypothetical protein
MPTAQLKVVTQELAKISQDLRIGIRVEPMTAVVDAYSVNTKTRRHSPDGGGAF